ncbi:transcobalamin-2 isoform X2 [Clarias gariepinus]|uniref:transcobalamin-2 isoform X2 n=1 Tax=Clarias gariepinus TaxID=13013 RepID=UPI00234D7133|nr:transcobalamin-2 isoform X2 [Clarias gariepinus]
MKMILCFIAALITITAADTSCGSDHETLLLQLNQDLLRATENQESLPNPSIHIALRLSTRHNLLKETQYLNQLKTKFFEDIERTLNRNEPVVGRLALYVMALKSSCDDLHNASLTVGGKSQPLLTHLKKQLELEKEHIASGNRPLTNYYQYSLGILALCLSGVRVNPHVGHKLIHASLKSLFIHGDSESVDTVAMAGMALQCLKEADAVQPNEELDKALEKIKQKLVNSQRDDGHLGNEFSTGLAVQALLAMGNKVDECDKSMKALWSAARNGSYHNPMAISQTLPALQQRSYLNLKNKLCLNEDDTLTLGPTPVVLPGQTVTVQVEIEVIKADGSSSSFQIRVPSGTSLLETMTLLQQKRNDFKFKTEDSLWGPFLSVLNGEQARQSDRRYWHIASDGKSLSQGVKDYKIEAAQKITFKNTVY